MFVCKLNHIIFDVGHQKVALFVSLYVYRTSTSKLQLILKKLRDINPWDICMHVCTCTQIRTHKSLFLLKKNIIINKLLIKKCDSIRELWRQWSHEVSLKPTQKGSYSIIICRILYVVVFLYLYLHICMNTNVVLHWYFTHLWILCILFALKHTFS